MSTIVTDKTDAAETLLRKILSDIVPRSIIAVTQLQIPDLLADGPRSCHELATLTQTDEPTLYRLLRFLCCEDIFVELGDKRFELGPLGSFLRSDTPDSIRGYALLYGTPYRKGAWDHILDSLHTGKKPFECANGKLLFPYLADHPEHEQTFQSGMIGLSQHVIPSVLQAYDFSPFDTIVDIGGGHGLLMEQLLRHYEQANGIVFDQAAVIEQTTVHMQKVGLADRCACVSGSFFESVPSGDALVLKHIIHDWTAEESIRILKHCRASIRADGKLLLLETIIPDGKNKHFSNLFDLEMLAMTSGQERTQAEYTYLLEQAGFRLNNIVHTSTFVSIIEGVPV
ncbi:methyltransferase [Paenibacillus sp. 481]|uniref:methyltransferase n=1 Tax=Paenibacillus sp. 481 TaxID=2835869 RepID=UPI001E2926CB|nr:methyltransferase [Paenibacillus sp. 481]UHA73616.1 hypothetical protein KIK04_00045 [Paenibacillus sp. 481]